MLHSALFSQILSKGQHFFKKKKLKFFLVESITHVSPPPPIDLSLAAPAPQLMPSPPYSLCPGIKLSCCLRYIRLRCVVLRSFECMALVHLEHMSVSSWGSESCPRDSSGWMTVLHMNVDLLVSS